MHSDEVARAWKGDLSMDFAQTNDPEDRLCVVATQPLTRNGNWQQTQPGQLLWIEEGRIVRQAQLEISEAVRLKYEASLACV